MAGTETRYCANCGERISVRSRFCPSCGARQEDFLVSDPEPAPIAAAEPPAPEPPAPEPPAQPASRDPRRAEEPPHEQPEPEPLPAPDPPAAEAPRAEPLRERIGRVDPQAGELSGLLMGRLAVPGVVAAGLAALAAAGAVLVAGLIIALATPDASILGLVGRDGSLISEAFRQAVSTLLAPVIDTGPLTSASGRLAPMIFVAIPIGAVALATRWQLHRTEGAGPAARIAWAAVVGLPFGLLMLAFAVLGGDSDVTNVSPSAGSAFGLGLLWGIVGGALGAATALPLEGAAEGLKVPAPVRRVLTAGAATLRPLGALLIACSALGLVGWIVQVGADVDAGPRRALDGDGARRGVALRRRARRPPRRPRFRRALHGRRQRGARPALPGRPGQRRARPRRRPAHLLLHRRDARLRLPPRARPALRPR